MAGVVGWTRKDPAADFGGHRKGWRGTPKRVALLAPDSGFIHAVGIRALSRQARRVAYGATQTDRANSTARITVVKIKPQRFLITAALRFNQLRAAAHCGGVHGAVSA